MDKMVYVAMSGAKSVMTRQATNNNNLANIATTGFREDLDASIDVPAPNRNMPTRVYSAVRPSGINGSAGDIINTGRNLDIAIEGDGMIAVANPDGSEAYTRSGNLRISPTGLLETSDGFPVMGNNGPITISPYETLEIAEDGTITIQPAGDPPGTRVELDRIKLVNPDTRDLERNENGLLNVRPTLTRITTINAQTGEFTPEDQAIVEVAPELEADANVQVLSGALETSNVNPARAMIMMVELSRVFELQLKLIKTAEDNDATMNKVLA